MKSVLLIDNYDSFTYNLAQYLGELGCMLTIKRNDAISVAEAKQLQPTHVVLSPGPGSPHEAGICNDLIPAFAGQVPILGVCLGHQCIGHVFGGKVDLARRMVHGKVSKIYHDGKKLFHSLPNPFEATRYHSLVVQEEGWPKELLITAHTSEGEVMGLRHRTLAIEGVQFHPESILTKVGKTILQNFLSL
jgi:anthranilate synthase/aminodeoxychorismate synthase-like glutamine amidotransferase